MTQRFSQLDRLRSTERLRGQDRRRHGFPDWMVKPVDVQFKYNAFEIDEPDEDDQYSL